MQNDTPLKTRLAAAARRLLADAAKTAWELFKIMVPLSILTKVLAEIGVVDALGRALAPLMGLLGLPGSMGLVWASALLTNIYGGIAVFASLAPGASLTAAQVTVITTIMLVAHAMPVELRIAQKAGARFRAMAAIRIAGALLLGFILHRIYAATGSLDYPAVSVWAAPSSDPSWSAWALSQAKNLAMISCIILVLLVVLDLLKFLRVTALFTRLLEPVLTMLGMSRAAAPVTVIGMTLGVSYGGGLIIREAQSGSLSKTDVFFSLTLMGLCHSLIEDTIVMGALGAHVSGILFARLAFALLVTFLLQKIASKLPQSFLDRHLFRPAPPSPSPESDHSPS